jgi:hypothetical protein
VTRSERLQESRSAQNCATSHINSFEKRGPAQDQLESERRTLDVEEQRSLHLEAQLGTLTSVLQTSRRTSPRRTPSRASPRRPPRQEDASRNRHGRSSAEVIPRRQRG